MVDSVISFSVILKQNFKQICLHHGKSTEFDSSFLGNFGILREMLKFSTR